MLLSKRAVVGLTVVALLTCYAATIHGMVGQWLTDEDMGHGVFVAPVALWILWREKRQWSAVHPRPSSWGWVLLIGAALVHLMGVLGGGLFPSAVAFLISILGCVLTLGGLPFLACWAFPLALLLFMLPKLALVYNQATLPLQLLASKLAAWLLMASGFGVIRSGNILVIGHHQILVSEACSGIRFLLPLAFAAALLGYLAHVKPWVRCAMVAAAVPIAIVANGVRVAVSGAAAVLAEGTAHAVMGVVVFALALAGILVLLNLFRRMSGDARA